MRSYHLLLFFFSLHVFAESHCFKVSENSDGTKDISWPYLGYYVHFQESESFAFKSLTKNLLALQKAIESIINEPQDPYESTPISPIFFDKYFNLKDLEKNEDFQFDGYSLIVPLIIKFCIEKTEWNPTKFFNFLEQCFNKKYYTSDDIEYSFNNYKVHETKKLDEEIVEYSIVFAYYNKQKNAQLEAKYAAKLAELYRKLNSPKDILYASGLYNYAYYLVPESAKNNLIDKMADTFKQLLHKFNINLSKNAIVFQINENREKLSSIRYKINQQIDNLNINKTYDHTLKTKEEISAEFTAFVIQILNNIINLLGAPPCKFALTAFGSFSNGLFSSYSDIEYTFIISRNDIYIQDYFQKFSYLFHCILINLGETLLLCFNRRALKDTGFLDVTTPRGFTFDGRAANKNRGGLTPFGDNQFSLIKTPKELAELQKDPYFVKNEAIVSFELITGGKFIFGDKQLVDEYKKEIKIYLDELINNKIKREVCAQRQFLLEQKNFDLNVLDSKEPINIKQALFMYPIILIHILCILEDVDGKDVYEKIDNLHLKNVINFVSAELLKTAIADAFWLKINIYKQYNEARNYVSFKPVLHLQNNDYICRNPHVLTTKEKEVFESAYKVFRNFYFESDKYIDSRKIIDLI